MSDCVQDEGARQVQLKTVCCRIVLEKGNGEGGNFNDEPGVQKHLEAFAVKLSICE